MSGHNHSEVVDLDFGTQGDTSDDCMHKCECINTQGRQVYVHASPGKVFLLTRGSEITSKAIFVLQIF